VIIIVISWNELSHTDALVLLGVYFLIRCEMILVKNLRDKEENQILREWDLHQKVDRISEILDDMVREQSRVGTR